MTDVTDPEIEPTSTVVLEPQLLGPGESVLTEVFWMAPGDYNLISCTGSSGALPTSECLSETIGIRGDESVDVVASTTLRASPIEPHVVQHTGQSGFYMIILTNLGTRSPILLEASLVSRPTIDERN